MIHSVSRQQSKWQLLNVFPALSSSAFTNSFFLFFPSRRLVSHFGSSFKTPPFHQFNKEVHSAKLGCYLKRLFFLDSFQQFYLCLVAIKKCLDLPISLTSDLATCISLYLLPWYPYICVAAYPSDTSLAPFLGTCGLPAYYVHKTITFTFTHFCIVCD